MARMHTHKKGKSKSHKPMVSGKWVRADRKKVEELVTRMSKEGAEPAKIGLMLRDQHAIPDVKGVLGISIDKFLRENKIYSGFPHDLLALIKKAVTLRKHLDSNKKDVHNRTRLHSIEAKINRLVKYNRGKKIPAGWKYSPDQAALLVK
ncbi:TPA: 30S ribosomal protein S15 [Candidatus Micrarchaeota archaeon]|nr:30S ribosomal protein S15 [Candidatus Micrarchaeota archaeon]